MMSEPPTAYHETQTGPWSVLLFIGGVAMLATAWMLNWQNAAIGLCIGGPIMLILAPCFHSLTIMDCGDKLIIRFGPLPLFQTHINYADIQAAEARRTLWIEGWGLRLSIRGGWLWNIWGRNCISIRRTRGNICVGTGNPEGLLALLHQKAPHLLNKVSGE